jgi:hypothetical protein
MFIHSSSCGWYLLSLKILQLYRENVIRVTAAKMGLICTFVASKVAATTTATTTTTTTTVLPIDL